MDPAAGQEPHDGSTWPKAYTDLQDALDAVGETPNHEIWVAKADPPYKPGSDQSDTFTLRNGNGLAIYGGFLGNAYPGGGETQREQRDPAANETILSGDLNGDDSTTGNGTNETAILDGFTITAGNANDYHGQDYSGCGMIKESPSPMLTDFTIRGNSASDNGSRNYVFCSYNLPTVSRDQHRGIHT